MFILDSWGFWSVSDIKTSSCCLNSLIRIWNYSPNNNVAVKQWSCSILRAIILEAPSITFAAFGWIWAENAALDISESILLLLPAVTLSVNISDLVPLTVINDQDITLPITWTEMAISGVFLQIIVIIHFCCLLWSSRCFCVTEHLSDWMDQTVDIGLYSHTHTSARKSCT